jgi:hypothetical protein
MSTWRPGSAIAAAPAPTQPADRYEAASLEYAGGGGVVVVVPVVVVVVVVVVDVVVVVEVVVSPAASADAAPSAARTTPSTTNHTPRRIGPVCRTRRRLGEIGPKSLQVSR